MTDRGKAYLGAVPPTVVTDTTGKRRFALVIGNSAYHSAGTLPNPGNDAEEMGKALLRLKFSVQIHKDVGRDRFEDLLGQFKRQIVGADAALLFFAGHGLQVKGENYLIPVDADIREEEHLKRRAFGLDEILKAMTEDARSSLVFLDACRNNPFSRSLQHSVSGDDEKRNLMVRGLAQVKEPKGSFIAFAAAPGSVASDGKGANSPFTEALLAHIDEPGLTVNGLMIKVRNSVMRATNDKQRPWDHSSLLEEVIFVPVATTAVGASSTQNKRVDILQLPRASNTFVARENELALLRNAWSANSPRVLALIAAGGTGKTALVAAFLNDLAVTGWPAADGVYAFSFDSQGTDAKRWGSSDRFFSECLAFFGVNPQDYDSVRRRAHRLADFMEQHRVLLVLDGIEPMQSPRGDGENGRLRDDAMSDFLRRLSQGNKGLCLITTRFPLPDLASYKSEQVTQFHVPNLALSEAVTLLRTFQIACPQSELE